MTKESKNLKTQKIKELKELKNRKDDQTGGVLGYKKLATDWLFCAKLFDKNGISIL